MQLNLNLLAIAIGRGIQAAVSLVLLKIMTRCLPPAEVGQLYILTAIASVFAVLFLNGTSLWIQRNILNWQRTFSAKSLFIELIALFGCTTLVAIVLTIPIFSFADLWSIKLSTKTLILGLTCGLFGQYFYYTMSTIQNTLGHPRLYALLMICGQGLVLACVCPIFWFSTPTAADWLLLLLAGYTSASCMFAIFISREIRGADRVKFATQFRRTDLTSILLPYIVIGTATWTQTQGYRIFFSATNTFEDLAVLGVGFGLANNFGSVLESFLQQYFGPILLRMKRDKPAELQATWASVSVRITVALSAGSLILYFLAPLLIELLTNKIYESAALFFRWGLLFETFRILASMSNFYFFVEDEMKRSVKDYAWGAGLTLVCYGVSLLRHHDSKEWLIAGIITGSALTYLLLQLRLRKAASP